MSSHGCLTRDSPPAYQLDNGKEVFPVGNVTNFDRFSDMVHAAHNIQQQEK
jgi:hypothetical protein